VYRDHRVAVVVPAFNEERHITRTVQGIPDFVDAIFVIDDASTDNTYEAALSLQCTRVDVSRLAENQGVGGAIVTGHGLALDRGCDVVVVMAGDDQMDPQYLPQLLDPICHGEVLFTKANRFYAMDSFEGMPRHRILGNILMSFMMKASSGYWQLFDPLNGYTAIHRSALERIPLHRVAKRYEFENDLLIHLNILRASARDVPVPARYGTERSDLRAIRVAPSFAWRLVKGFWRRIFWKYVLQSFSPVAVMLFSGLALMLVGLAVGIFIVAHTLGPPEASAGTVLLSVGPLLTGVHLLVTAWMLDIQEAAA
jgi:glycosyltransferase involved in cell wall biosynthesis